MAQGPNQTVQSTETKLEAKIPKWASALKRGVDFFLVVGAAALGFWLVAMIFVGSPSDYKATLKDNKQIEKKIDSITESNKLTDERIQMMERNQVMFIDMISANNNLMRENNQELKKLKNVYNKKITTANAYSVSQLDSFFKERYKQFYNAN